MPDMRRILIAGCTMIALAACSGAEPQATGPSEADAALMRLIDDARYEVLEGNLPEAGRLYDLALQEAPADALIWTDIARLRYRGGEHAGALEAVDYALSIDARYAPALLMRAQLVRDAHGPVTSLTWFESGLALNPNNVDLLANYAATLGDAGRHREMLAVTRQLAAVDPDEPRVHYLQAVLAARAGDPVTANSLLKRSGMQEEGNPAAMMLGAIIEMQQGNFDNAVAALQKMADRQPGNPTVEQLLARALWLNGRDREIVDRFAERAAQPDASPYLNMTVGRSFERLGDRRNAAIYINRARTLSGGNLLTLSSRNFGGTGLPPAALAMRESVVEGNGARASKIASDLTARFPQSADIAVLAGDGALVQGNYNSALEQYARASQIRRPWPLTRKIIHAFRAADDWDAADALLAKHLKSEPRNTEAMIMLAERSAASEDWLRAAVLLDTAVALGAGNDIVLLELRLDAARALGDEATAARIATALARLRPGPFA